MIKFLQDTYAPSKTPAEPNATKYLDQMSGPELLSLHNLVASNLGKGGTKRFSDNEAARRRTWAILQEYDQANDETLGQDTPAPAPTPTPAPAPTTPKAKVERKKRGMRFVFPAESEQKPVREDSARGKALAVLTRKGGGTFAEVQAATGWNEKQAYEGIRLLHYYSGYGLAQEERDGQTFIIAHTGKK